MARAGTVRAVDEDMRVAAEDGSASLQDPVNPIDGAVANLEKVYDIAKMIAPTVIFFDEGDSLAYYHNAPFCSIVFTDASANQEWFINWNEEDGTGSLRVPDYKEGQEACWDQEQNDIECEVLP